MKKALLLILSLLAIVAVSERSGAGDTGVINRHFRLYYSPTVVKIDVPVPWPNKSTVTCVSVDDPTVHASKTQYGGEDIFLSLPKGKYFMQASSELKGTLLSRYIIEIPGTESSVNAPKSWGYRLDGTLQWN
jgi:hypothetical protein